MKVLIIANSFKKENLENILFVEENGESFIDRQIRKVQGLGYPVEVVLSTHLADEILRKSKRIQNCEIIFDADIENCNFLSSLRAGLLATSRECFVLPIEIPCPGPKVWQSLRRHFYRQEKLDLVQVAYPKSGQLVETFPALISNNVKSSFDSQNTSKSMDDLQLNRSFIPILDYERTLII